MHERWYRRAVIYSVEVDAFCDSDGDGIGDIRGLIGHGVTAEGRPALEVFADQDYGPLPERLDGIRLGGFGYRWVRLRAVA